MMDVFLERKKIGKEILLAVSTDIWVCEDKDHTEFVVSANLKQITPRVP